MVRHGWRGGEAMPKGKATPLALTPEEPAELVELVRRRKTAQDSALRARIVLRCADGVTNQGVAGEARVCAHTVGKWRERFANDRLEGLRDGPRSGAPRAHGHGRAGGRAAGPHPGD